MRILNSVKNLKANNKLVTISATNITKDWQP